MATNNDPSSRPISDEEYEELCRNEILEEIWRAEHEESEKPYYDDDGYYHGLQPHKKRGLPPDEYYYYHEDTDPDDLDLWTNGY